MGEYIMVDGEETKLGTCEDLYYVRYADLVEAVKSGRTAMVSGNLSPRQYLDPQYGFRFRFPFPDEDGKDIGEYEEYDRGYTICAPLGFMEGVDHREMIHGLSPLGQPHGGHYLTVKTPCPQAPDNPKRHVFKANGPASGNPNQEYEVIQIVQQRPMEDGKLWTVARCAYCGARFRFDEEDALKLIDYERSVYREIRHVQLFHRIMAGYGYEFMTGTAVVMSAR